MFQEFESDEQYYLESFRESNLNKYHFSSLLFQNPNKLEEFVFRKCITMLGISVDLLLEKFKIVPRQ